MLRSLTENVEVLEKFAAASFTLDDKTAVIIVVSYDYRIDRAGSRAK
jgi:hypothetical protein